MDASFDKKGNRIALLSKIHPESAAPFYRVHFYNSLGEYQLTSGEPDKAIMSGNIDFSEDGESLLFCSDDSVYVYSTKNGREVCPPLISKFNFLRARYTADGRIKAEFADGTKAEYAIHHFKMSEIQPVAEPEKKPEDKEYYVSAINDNLYLENKDPDIALIDRDGNTLDEVKGIMNLPYGMNDGILYWGGNSVDRESSVGYCFGYTEQVFYRVKYDEDACKIENVEPIVLSGRQSNAVFAFDGMCAVQTTDGYLLGYHNDESEPFFEFVFKTGGQDIVSFHWLENNIMAIVFNDYSQDRTFSLQLWDVKNGACLTTLEEASGEEISDVKYKDGVLSYWKGRQSRCWLLNTVDPDASAIRFLSGISCYKMDETGAKKFGTPILFEDLGNWADILSVE